MINIFKAKIDVQTDTLQSAIGKKNHNQSLSNKTLSKLATISNSHYDLKKGEANFIFEGKELSGKINSRGICVLLAHFNEIKKTETNPLITSHIDKWTNTAQKLLSQNESANNQGKSIGKGARGVVYKQDGFVIKVIQDFNRDEALHETKMCNAYSATTGQERPEATLVGKNIKMPFVSGVKPNNKDTLKGVLDMFEKGFFMGDAKPSNFVRTSECNIFPVDFGLVFTRDKLATLPVGIKKAIISDYAKGGFRYIPSEIKSEYVSSIKVLDESLGRQSPIRKMNTKELTKAGFVATFE
jgi:hypothetical protein